jgi:hypothetical protein
VTILRALEKGDLVVSFGGKKRLEIIQKTLVLLDFLVVERVRGIEPSFRSPLF